jgi:exopolyphosphatase/guanosine-5'-triphosphate,3'-diphosphate pyrophosphatase
MTTLAAIVLGLEGFQKERIHGLSISLSTLDEWVGRLSGMSIAERRTLPGMEPGREDLLLQGMILMREIVASLGTDSFVVSTYGARYGVLYERM